MTNKSPDIQLSYMDLQRLSGYEISKRKCWTIFNRQTKELARVVSNSAITACLHLEWDIKVCDVSDYAWVKAPFGIMYKKPLTIRRDRK